MSQTGSNHWHWRNGRTLLSSGYIGIRVPKDHHLRMKNQYAYEHRLVAELKLGRKLKKGEIVHHLNGIKTDNRPENIEILESIFDHKVEHRKKNNKRRKPGQENILILCACGCGNSFMKFDKTGRPRKYLEGHWRKGRKGGW